MRELSTIVSRAQGLLLSVLAASGDVAEQTGARSAGDWYAAATRHDHRPSVGLDRLGRSLDTTTSTSGAAVLDGRVNLDQAMVIVHALDDLPSDDISPEIRERAELHLIGLADDFAPTPLRRLAGRSSRSSPPRSARKPNARPSNEKSNSPPNTPDSPSPR